MRGMIGWLGSRGSKRGQAVVRRMRYATVRCDSYSQHGEYSHKPSGYLNG